MGNIRIEAALNEWKLPIGRDQAEVSLHHKNFTLPVQKSNLPHEILVHIFFMLLMEDANGDPSGPFA